MLRSFDMCSILRGVLYGQKERCEKKEEEKEHVESIPCRIYSHVGGRRRSPGVYFVAGDGG